MKKLIREIHRRSLWQVLGIYIVGAWVVLQVVEVLGTIATLPEWFPGFALGLLVVGLPIVLATAFVQEGGPGHHPEPDDEEVVLGAEAVDASSPWRIFTWKNAILGGVGAFALLGFVGAGWFLFGWGAGVGVVTPEAPASIERSVAVLPFTNMSGDPDNEYFSDGITEEILNALVQLPGVRVPGRTSSFAFKDQSLTIRQIADTLRVANILEGSVRQDGGRVRITAQLIDAGTDTHLWSETYERDIEDVFSVQREIATAIASQLQITLDGGATERLISGETEIPEAHDAYLRGRYLWARRTREAVQASIAQFERAVALDPSYADAYSGLADAYTVFAYNYGRTVEEIGRLADGRLAAERAVELAPQSGMAHASLGLSLADGGEWEEAEREFDQAIALNPGYATAHQWLGLLYTSTGRAEEGLEAVRRAAELDPISVAANISVAQFLWASGAFEESVQAARDLVALDPARSESWSMLGRALLEAGAYEAAADAWEEGLRLNPGADRELETQWRQSAIRYSQTGEAQPFRAPEEYFSLNRAADVYAMTGQVDPTLEALEALANVGLFQGIGEFHHTWDHTKLDLLDNPRYQAILDEAGITW